MQTKARRCIFGVQLVRMLRTGLSLCVFCVVLRAHGTLGRLLNVDI